MRIVIAGCGYVGLRAGKLLKSGGHEVFGIRRSEGGLAEVASAGLTPLKLDLLGKPLLELPEGTEAVINTVSSSGSQGDQYRAVYVEGNKQLIQASERAGATRYIYTSSTGVYDQTDGSWVDETSPTNPSNPTSGALIEAEQVVSKATFRKMILRVAGIYGPGRGYHFKQYLKGEVKLTHRFLNMVHVDDVAAVIASNVASNSEGVFNLVDDEPVLDLTYYEWFEAQLGKKVITETATDVPKSKRVSTNKKVSNGKLKALLNYQFKYPTFREGFAEAIQIIRQANVPPAGE